MALALSQPLKIDYGPAENALIKTGCPVSQEFFTTPQFNYLIGRKSRGYYSTRSDVPRERIFWPVVNVKVAADKAFLNFKHCYELSCTVVLNKAPP